MQYDKLRRKGSHRVRSWVSLICMALFLIVSQGLGWWGYILKPDMLLLAAVGFMLWMFFKALVYQHWLYGIYDLERVARDIVQDTIDQGKSVEEAVAKLVSGDAFKCSEGRVKELSWFNRMRLAIVSRVFRFMENRNQNSLEDTGIAKMFADIDNDLTVNSDIALDVQEYLDLYLGRISALIRPVIREANEQTTFGFFGTVFGLVVGLTQVDWSALQTADSVLDFIVVFAGGLGVSLVTTLCGIAFGWFLSRRNHRLDTSFTYISQDLIRACLTMSRVLGDEKRVKVVAEKVKTIQNPQSTQEGADSSSS